jgi:hypothetical protein
MNAHRFAAATVAACAAVALVAGCGSSTTTTSKPASSPTTSAPASGSASAGTITKNWETFFDGSTPVSTRESLLEDGSSFPTASLAPSALSKTASAKVLSVTDITSSTAKVSYDVLLSGAVALKNEVGTSVYQDGTWKVGVSSFCGLLTLEVGASKVPSICRTA